MNSAASAAGGPAYKMFLDNEYIGAEGGKTIEVRNEGVVWCVVCVWYDHGASRIFFSPPPPPVHDAHHPFQEANAGW
jgi:hypothetical protein